MFDRLALVMFDCFALASEHRRIGYLAAILKFVGPVYKMLDSSHFSLGQSEH